MPQDLLALLEQTVETRAFDITVSMALNLVHVFSKSGSNFTLELVDRIIIANIDEMSPKQIYDAFLALACTEKADVRPKITHLLMKALSENLFNYSNEQLLGVCQVFFAGGPETGSELIKTIGIDEFLIKYGISYGLDELILATEIFDNSTLSELKQHFETQFIKTIRYLDVEQVSNTFYQLVSKKIGSPELVSTVLERALSDSSLMQTMDAQIICQNLITFSIAGVNPKNADYITYSRALAQDDFFPRLSIEERAILEIICLEAQKFDSVSENKSVQELLARILKRLEDF